MSIHWPGDIKVLQVIYKIHFLYIYWSCKLQKDLPVHMGTYPE